MSVEPPTFKITFEEGGNKQLLAFDHGRNGSMLDFFTEIQNKLEPIQETDMVKYQTAS